MQAYEAAHKIMLPNNRIPLKSLLQHIHFVKISLSKSESKTYKV